MKSIEVIIAAVVVISMVGAVALRSSRRGASVRNRSRASDSSSAVLTPPKSKKTARDSHSLGTVPRVEPRPRNRSDTEPSIDDRAVVRPSATERVRPNFSGAFGSLFKRHAIDDGFWSELEDSLILADVGLETANRIVEESKQKVRQAKISDATAALSAVREAMEASLLGADRSLNSEGQKPVVWLFIGVNGVGKTTSIGKIALYLSKAGNRVMMAGADTFRAAAADQLGLWAQRARAEIVTGQPGSDPASVLFDAITSARAKGYDVVLGDTAGRLHNKFNLIEELKKIYRTVEKAQGTLGEVLLVLDATVGQNGLAQAKVFSEAVGVTGVVLTKLDGSAKGGIAFAIEQNFQIPVKLIGVGEGIDDLEPFDPKSYVESLTRQD